MDVFQKNLNQTKINAVSVAVAGHVSETSAKLPNLDWTFETNELSRSTQGAQAFILNDLQAQGYAVFDVPADQLTPVRQGTSSSGNKLVIGIGTGFNVAPVIGTKNTAVVPPVEAGHVRLAIQSVEDRAILDRSAPQSDFISVEDILSGRGLLALFQHWPETPSIASGAEIAKLAEINGSPAQSAMQFFARYCGQIAGDLALNHLPLGGIYFIGGVSRAATPFFQSEHFAQGFTDKGRFSDFMNKFSVSVVNDDDMALVGCGVYAHGQFPSNDD